MSNTIPTSTPSSPSPSATAPPHPSSYCDLPLFPLHSLSCGHIILSPLISTSTSTSLPSLPHAHPKLTCTPNCTHSTILLKPQLPLSWLKHTSPEPFICPQCVEECVRADYEMLLAGSLQLGQGLGLGQNGTMGSGSSKEINIRLWTYAAMMDMVRDGGRERQGTAGLFCTQDESVVGVLTQTNVERPSAVDAWRTRESGEGAGQHDDGGQDCRRLSLMLDDQDERGRGRTHEDVDKLADMLQDARVGLESGDGGVDELIAGVEGLMA